VADTVAREAAISPRDGFDITMSSTRARATGTYSFIVVSNRLPVDRAVDDAGDAHWAHSPGGLVTALEPVMRAAEGAWVGWVGQPDAEFAPFDTDGIRIVPVPLTADEVENYYEGFSNDTLWPLYHDVIAAPGYHRVWWDSYVAANEKFAAATAEIAAHGATVWVQDYQLQLLPKLLRALRPDLTIGFFNHIPSALRHLLAAALAHPDHRGASRCRRHRLSACGRREQLLARRAPPYAARHARGGRRRSR